MDDSLGKSFLIFEVNRAIICCITILECYLESKMCTEFIFLVESSIFHNVLKNTPLNKYHLSFNIFLKLI